MTSDPSCPYQTLIVGLGKTGLSCARFLARRGVSVAITDTRERPPGLAQIIEEYPDLPLFLGGFDPARFTVAQQLVVSPGVPVREPLIQAASARGVPVLGDIELFAREVRAPVAAVTGSNGKSTVTSLLGLMARLAGWRTAVGGNLGEPALELIDADCELYVLELSSFQLETTRSLRAKAAAVLNVSPDHMDRYPSLDEYVAAKAGIYRGAEVGVVNRDDPRVCAMSGMAVRNLGFTLGEPDGEDFGVRTHRGEAWLCRGESLLFPAAELSLPGRHNRSNVLAALALGHALGLPTGAMRDALRQFPGLPHRTQLIAHKAGVRWFNDSKGTNVGACVAALEGLHDSANNERAVLIAGGDCKGADFAPLVPVLERVARAVVLMGRDAPRLAEVLEGRLPWLRASSMEQAVKLAAQAARPGDYVLLSPACASFDMFRNFEHRGEAFVDAVEALSV